MRAGETVPVTIAGQVVAQATVKELGDGTATLVVPATLVVMAVRTELAVEQPAESTSETVITGVDRPEPTVEETGGTPEVSMPPVTAPSSDEVVQGEAGNVVEPVEPATPVEQVAPVEPTSPVVSDAGGGGDNAVSTD